MIASRALSPASALAGWCALSAALLSPSCLSSASPGWARSYTFSEVLKRSTATKRFILLKVVSDYCPPCREMDRTLAEDKVRAELVGFIKLQYHAGETEGEDLVRRYKLGGYPHLLAIDGNGRVIGHTGAVTSDAMVKWLQQTREIGLACEKEGLLARRPGDLALRLRVGSAWAKRGNRKKAELHLQQVLAEDKDNSRGYGARALLALARHLYFHQLRIYALAERTFRELKARFPRSPAASEATPMLARAIRAQGRSREALKVLKGWARSPVEHDLTARILHRWGMTEEGIRHARRAVRMKPHEARFWMNLGFLQHKGDHKEESLVSLSRAISLDPQNEMLRMMYRHVKQSD